MMMHSSSQPIDQLTALVELIRGDEFKSRLAQLRAAEASARQAEAHAVDAKRAADAAIRVIAQERAELEKLRATVAAERAEADAKLAKVRELREFIHSTAQG
jgi:hypothetical protein